MRNPQYSLLPAAWLLILAWCCTANAAPNIEMVFIKGGCFQMGDTFGEGSLYEKPVHKVCLDDFNMGKFVVTQGQWQAVMGNNPSFFKGCGLNCPVEQVSWDEAQEFIRRLNSQTGKNYRLPYEAEWEYAARSGGKLERWAGTSNTKELSSYAWTKDENDRITHPVGTKKPNGLGLFDMTGNVWEWCKDWYDEDFYKKSPENNPHGPLTGSAPVIRGGSWNDDAARVRATSRSSCDPDIHVSLIGFRVVLPVGK